MKINVARLGRMDYKEALCIQEKLHDMRRSGEIGDVLLIVEHFPVLTVGRRGEHSNILVSGDYLDALGVKVYDVSRGGDVTYHGPGQLVSYPIFNLGSYGRDIKDFVFRIEEVFIRLLRELYGIKAHREDKKYTGVWVGDKKITAIGIAVKHWVSMHGFAFNVNTNLEHFKWITPCGITDRGVTSLQEILAHELDFNEVNENVVKYFCDVFNFEAEEIKIEELIDSKL